MNRLSLLVLVALVGLPAGAPAPGRDAARPAEGGPDPALRPAAFGEEPSASIAFVGVHVVSMETDTVLRDRTVLVEDGLISRIGPVDEVSVAGGVRRIEGEGRYLMPGLFDLHAHPADTTDFLPFLAHGVTSVQPLNAGPSALAWERRVAEGGMLGPRLFPCEGPVSGLHDPVRARERVARDDSLGFRCIKIYGDVSAEALEALVGEARRRGMRSLGHIPRNLGWRDMLAAGPDAVAHAEEFLYSPIRSRAELDTIAARMGRNGIGLVATLVNYDYITRQPVMLETLLTRGDLETYPPVDQRVWKKDLNHYMRDFSPERVPELRRRLGFQRRFTKLLADAGVRVLVGTDAGNHFVLPGVSVHEELALLVGAGLSPYEALVAATRDAAEFLGLGSELGTVTEGKRADLVLVYGDPLEDVAAARLIAGVVAAGRWLDRAELRARRELLVAGLEVEGLLVERLERRGTAAALRWLERVRHEHPGGPLLRPRALNELGYQLWRIQDRLPDAIRVFEANARLHPGWWAAHGSLGEAYEAVGRSGDAARAYRRAVELNPDARDEAARLRALESPTGGGPAGE